MRFSIILTLLLDHEESKEIPGKKKSISASGITVSESTRAPYLRNLTFPEKTYLPWETCMWVKKQVDNLRDLWENVKRPNIRIIGVPEEEDKKKGHEKLLEEIIAENFPKKG